MFKGESKEVSPPISIRTGTLFAPKSNIVTSEISSTIRMVIDPKEKEGAFSAVTVDKVDDEGVPHWNLKTMGTITPKYIGRIIDHVDLETVKKGLLSATSIPRKDIEALLDECAKKGKRNLNIRVEDLSRNS